MPLISVVIPLFNKRQYILRSIESVLHQTIQDFEIIVVDDGSTDGSGDVAKSANDARLRVVRQDNRGVSAARNRGIAEASGELVALLDGDDEWLPEFLESIVDLHHRYPQAGILATGFRRRKAQELDTETTLTWPGKSHTHLIGDYLALALDGNFITSSSVAVPRAVLMTVGGFIEGEPFGEDRDLWIRIGLRYPVAYDSRIRAIYHSEADGRACNQRPASAYPPAVSTLNRAIVDGSISGDRVRQAAVYIDAVRMQYAYWHLNLRNLKSTIRLLEEKYLTNRYRAEAILVRFALRFLPMRVVAALKFKPERLLAGVKQLYAAKWPSLLRTDSRCRVTVRVVQPQ